MINYKIFMEELVTNREKAETWTSAKQKAINTFITKFENFSPLFIGLHSLL